MDLFMTFSQYSHVTTTAIVLAKVFVTKENANVYQIMNMPKIAHTMDVSPHCNFGY